MPRGTTQVVTRGASNDWCQMCRYEVRGGRASVRGTVAVRGVSTRQYEVLFRWRLDQSACDTWHWRVTRGTGVCQSEGCKDLEISHLCFADDFLVLCHGDMQSVKVVKKALDSFSALSGLVPNLGKRIIFFGNLEESIINEILEIIPFKIGKLLVSYLGVPLITKQIGVNECK
ncbi:hypothetical protein Tco_1282118 [Tanacetum coccineum]